MLVREYLAANDEVLVQNKYYDKNHKKISIDKKTNC